MENKANNYPWWNKLKIEPWEFEMEPWEFDNSAPSFGSWILLITDTFHWTHLLLEPNRSIKSLSTQYFMIVVFRFSPDKDSSFGFCSLPCCRLSMCSLWPPSDGALGSVMSLSTISKLRYSEYFSRDHFSEEIWPKKLALHNPQSTLDQRAQRTKSKARRPWAKCRGPGP